MSAILTTFATTSPRSPEHSRYSARLGSLTLRRTSSRRDLGTPAPRPQTPGGRVPPKFVVTSFSAIMQPAPLKADVTRMSRTLEVGQTIRLDDLAAWFVDRGLERVDVVEVPGEFSIRGGILDIFPRFRRARRESSSSATKSNRSGLSIPSRNARSIAGTTSRSPLAPKLNFSEPLRLARRSTSFPKTRGLRSLSPTT